MSQISSEKMENLFVCRLKNEELLIELLFIDSFLLFQKYPHHLNHEDSFGRSPLFYASEGFTSRHLQCVQLFLDAKCDVTRKDSFGDNSLMVACQNGRTEIAGLLIATKEYDLNQRNKNGRTCLHVAVEHGHKEVSKLLLLLGADVNVPDDIGGTTPLIMAIGNNNMEILDMLMEYSVNVIQPDKCGRTPLHYACIAKSEYSVRQLLEKGAEVNCFDHLQQPPLHHVMDQAKIIKMLVDAGSSLDYKHPSKDLSTVLHFSMKVSILADEDCTLSRHDFVKYLIESGADVNGRAPIELAVAANLVEIVLLLLKYNCDIHGSSPHYGPIHIAAMNGNLGLICILYYAGASLSQFTFRKYVAAASGNDTGNNLYKHVDKMLQKPQRLTCLCKRKIRSCLGPEIHNKMESLPIPNVIRAYVELQDLLHMDPKDPNYFEILPG